MCKEAVLKEMSRRAIVEAVLNIRYVDTWALVEIIERDLVPLIPDTRGITVGGGFVGKMTELANGTKIIQNVELRGLKNSSQV